MAKNNIDWSPVGFFKRPKSIRMFYDAAVNLQKKWNPNTTAITYNTFDRIEKVVFPLIDTSNVTNMEGAFANFNEKFGYYVQSFLVYLPQLNTSNVTNMKNMFNMCRGLKNIPQLDTSKTTNMYYMFMNCNSLTSIPQLDTAKVTDMYGMFYHCYSLIKTPIIDISSCTDMFYMFNGCSSLTEVWFKGKPQNNINLENMFKDVTTTGTFYYDSRYNYTKIINALPSGWTSVAWNYETNQPA